MWSPVSRRSSAGQRKFAWHSQRPTFYHCATQPTSSRSRSSVGWRSSVGAEAECVTSDWTAVRMSSCRHCRYNMKRKPTASGILVAFGYAWIVGWTQIRQWKGWSSVVGVLSCRESNASTANSGVGFWYNVGTMLKLRKQRLKV